MSATPATGDVRRCDAGSAVLTAHDSRPENIVVPLDGSRGAARAILPARRLAAALGLQVGAVTVAGAGTELDRASLESLRARHRLHWVDVVESSSAAEGIVALGRERDAVIVMATETRGPSGGIVGATVSAVLEHAGRPVLLVGPGTDTSERRPINELVVAVSGAPSGEAICRRALRLARTEGFGLRFVTVVEPIPEPVDPQTPTDREFGPVGDEHVYMADLVARHQAPGLHVEGSVIDVPLSPAAGLASMLRHHPQSLLLVGSGGRSGTERLRSGSVAGSIVSRSPVPTIVVPTSSER